MTYSRQSFTEALNEFLLTETPQDRRNEIGEYLRRLSDDSGNLGILIDVIQSTNDNMNSIFIALYRLKELLDNFVNELTSETFVEVYNILVNVLKNNSNLDRKCCDQILRIVGYLTAFHTGFLELLDNFDKSQQVVILTNFVEARLHPEEIIESLSTKFMELLDDCEVSSGFFDLLKIYLHNKPLTEMYRYWNKIQSVASSVERPEDFLHFLEELFDIDSDNLNEEELSVMFELLKIVLGGCKTLSPDDLTEGDIDYISYVFWSAFDSPLILDTHINDEPLKYIIEEMTFFLPYIATSPDSVLGIYERFTDCVQKLFEKDIGKYFEICFNYTLESTLFLVDSGLFDVNSILLNDFFICLSKIFDTDDYPNGTHFHNYIVESLKSRCVTQGIYFVICCSSISIREVFAPQIVQYFSKSLPYRFDVFIMRCYKYVQCHFSFLLDTAVNVFKSDPIYANAKSVQTIIFISTDTFLESPSLAYTIMEWIPKVDFACVPVFVATIASLIPFLDATPEQKIEYYQFLYNAVKNNLDNCVEKYTFNDISKFCYSLYRSIRISYKQGVTVNVTYNNNQFTLDPENSEIVIKFCESCAFATFQVLKQFVRQRQGRDNLIGLFRYLKGIGWMRDSSVIYALFNPTRNK